MVLVQPGDYVCSRRPLILQTLLGSCVAACLYDPKSGTAGLNHFLLASPRFPKSQPLLLSEAGRYGVHAMELLINGMMKEGAQRSRIRAKVFGGATSLNFKEGDDFFKISQMNQKFILEFLKVEKISLDAADLGGEKSRVIYFNTQNRQVILRYIAPRAATALERDEQRYWQRELHRGESDFFLF